MIWILFRFEIPERETSKITEESVENLSLQNILGQKRRLNLLLQCLSRAVLSEAPNLDEIRERCSSLEGFLSNFLRVFHELMTISLEDSQLETVVKLDQELYKTMGKAKNLLKCTNKKQKTYLLHQYLTI